MVTSTTASLRQMIDAHLQERLQAKINALRSDDERLEEKRHALRERFQREVWLADAARRVRQLQVVTHVAKATHPDSKASSLYVPPGNLAHQPLVGSHVLGDDYDTDVVGNAAALDIFKFLKLEHDGRSLLARALNEDPDLANAFNDDADQGMEWVRAFAAITETRDPVQSDPCAKQIYWLAGDDPTRDADFHLLTPLFSTVLAHRVNRTISHDRFSDEARQAADAYYRSTFAEREYRSYPALAEQLIGGAQPQNVSQLNSERRGVNYLLPSLPPHWRSRGIKPLLYTESAFTRFGRRPAVRRVIDELRSFLRSAPPSNRETRARRRDYVAALIDELMLFTAEHWELEPGWTQDPACKLSPAQNRWLDPGRYQNEPDPEQQIDDNEWQAEIHDRFAAWLNAQLGRAVPVGDDEHRAWRAQVQEETNGLLEALSDG